MMSSVIPAEQRAAISRDGRDASTETPAEASSSPVIDWELARRLVRDQFAIIETGDLDLATANVTPDYVNHRSVHEPLPARDRGPDAMRATATWLRRAFSDIRFEIEEFEVVGDRAVAWVTMRGVHTGPHVVHDSADGAVTEVFPPTGRAFATRQVHWFRIADAAIAEHDAVRDDLGMAKQIGWIPPTPSYVVRMLTARRRERRRRRRADW
jgi:ketosteroid isomerase-like protein